MSTLTLRTPTERRRYERRWNQRRLRRLRAKTYIGTAAPPVLKAGRVLHLFCGPHAFGYGRL